MSLEAGDKAPLLRWLIFTGTCTAGIALAWHFGLIGLMLDGDKTYISSVILLICLLATLHCFSRTQTITRELDRARRVQERIEKSPASVTMLGTRLVAGDGLDLPEGVVTDHIRNLAIKAKLQRHGRLDQTLLLHSLADSLRGPNQPGNFASDIAMKLGLLGTIIGFIMMLAPIAGLDMADRVSVKSSMGLMSNGMAVAMYTTLTGLVGGILIKTQYYLLDIATAELFRIATCLTEVYVVSVLERERDGEFR